MRLPTKTDSLVEYLRIVGPISIQKRVPSSSRQQVKRRASRQNVAWHLYQKGFTFKEIGIVFYKTDGTGKKKSIGLSSHAVRMLYLAAERRQKRLGSLPTPTPEEYNTWCQYQNLQE